MADKPVRLLPSAKKSLAKLEKSNPAAARIILREIELLTQNPARPGDKKMRGKKAEYRRIRAGNHRIVYLPDDSAFVIVSIGPRNDNKVYRGFKRRGD